MAEPPSAFDQFRIVIDESAFGLPVSTAEDLNSMVSKLGFERTMLCIARIANRGWHTRGETDVQIAMAREVFGQSPLTDAITSAARQNDRLEIFPEQHASVLQRLLVLRARSAAVDEYREGEQETFNRAWLAAAAPTGAMGRHEDAPRDRLDMVAMLIQNGTYNSVEDTITTMIRPQILFRDIAESDAARAHPHFCPIDEWHRDKFGLGLAAQFALGLALAAKSNVFDDGMSLADGATVGAPYLHDAAQRLGLDRSLVEGILTGDRDWYREQFERRPDSVENMAWDRIPFEARPLLRLSTGAFLALSPRAFDSWIGDGAYHRSLAAARAKGKAEQFLAFYGFLVEEHVHRLLQSAHAKPGTLAPCRVLGEQRYGRGGGKKSPDVAIDCGPDIVLIEVCGGRFTLRTVVEGDPQTAIKELGHLVFDKAAQLDRRVTEFLDEEWLIPGIKTSDVHRIWPVVVTADVLQNEILWDEIGERLPDVFRQSKVQPLTLLDVGEVELLSALVEKGQSLVDLLAKKGHGPYSKTDFTRFVFDSAGLTHEVRAALIEERWISEIDEAAKSFGFDFDERDVLARITEERLHRKHSGNDREGDAN
jgi:hypothetical protein